MWVRVRPDKISWSWYRPAEWVCKNGHTQVIYRSQVEGLGLKTDTEEKLFEETVQEDAFGGT